MGGIVSVKRLLIVAAAAFLLALALAASASARTAYEYVYSGEYIDGSATGHPFGAEIGALEYDSSTETLYVTQGNGDSASFVHKFSPAGSPQDFSALGSPTANVGPGMNGQGEISVDQSGTDSDGRIYLNNSGGGHAALEPDGTQILPEWPIDFVSPENSCGVAVLSNGEVVISSRTGMFFVTPEGKIISSDFAGFPGLEPGTKLKYEERGRLCKFKADSNDFLYGLRPDDGENHPSKFTTDGVEIYELSQDNAGPFFGSSESALAIDRSDDSVFVLERPLFASEGWFTQYDEKGAVLGTNFGMPDPAHSFPGLVEPVGIAVDPVTHAVFVADRREYEGGTRRVEKFIRVPAGTVPDVESIPPGYPSPTGATAELRGVVDPDGVETTDCHFEYGTTQALGSTAPCEQGDNLTGSGAVTVTATVPVTKGGWYFYRVVAENSNGLVQTSGPTRFIPQGKPILGFFTGAERVNTDGVFFTTEFDPNGGNGSVHFEYGTNGEFQFSTPESKTFGFNSENGNFEGSDFYEPGTYKYTAQANGLQAGTTYEWRAVISNEAGSVTSPAQTVTTYKKDPGTDGCPNAHVRQQTESSLLDDCRAYELVSAANAGGYDVESDIVPDQSPLDAYPRATDSVLYSVHFGVIPGIAGSPTNLGLDPYVATRGADGWTTRYVGLPADGMSDPGKFGSPLLEADPRLSEFAFGGPQICAPCFADGSTNIPLRLGGGDLVKGMAGSQSPPADPVGFVGQRFSADGVHFVFGADTPFETSGRDGEVSIYDRNLDTGVTQVVSTLPAGSTMSEAVGPAGELAISADGSRIVVGEEVSSDAAGNSYWHPYMHIGASSSSVDLAPGTTSGVLFAGMSADGSRVYYVTPDALAGEDDDASADLYEAQVGSGGPVTPRLVSDGSSGTVGQVDTCDPAANDGGNNWNAVGAGSPNSCGVIAIAGGGGVSANGTVYFFSPEPLDGEGAADEPNLFAASPGGQPRFVATVEPDNPAVVHGVADNEARRYGDFQVAASGRYVVFNTHLSLSGAPNLGFDDIYRFDLEEGQLDCVSCSPTGSAQGSDVSLLDHGLNLADDGRVFYTTAESFALRDTNRKRDAYEWNDGAFQLISAGIGPQDSGLVTVSADGVNAYFFTRDKLVPTDQNGNTVKIYDAREEGGFPFDAARLPCAASDECHGPGTPTPSPPDIATYTGAGTAGAPTGGGACGALAGKAKAARKQAAALRRRAANAGSPRQARTLRTKAARHSRQAKKLSRRATACQRTIGGNR